MINYTIRGPGDEADKLLLEFYCLQYSMVLSRAAVMSYVESLHRCPSNDTADDMFLGSVAAALHWDIVHSPLFHQVECWLTLCIACVA